MAQTARALHGTFNVISVISDNSKLATYLDKDNCIELEKKSKLFIYFSANKLAKIIDKYNVKIIHIHWTKDIPLVVLGKLLSVSKPKIVQSRHMTMTRFKKDFYHKFLYKNIALLLPVTNQVHEQLKKFISTDVIPKVITLYPGVESNEELTQEQRNVLKRKLKFEDENFNIVMVGRINHNKGQYLLIDAIEVLIEKGINVKAYFIGNAMNRNYLNKLKMKVKNKNLENYIEFLGFMNNVNEVYQISDAMVLASKKETFGLVLVEAMMASTAVIGSNSGGVVEIIDDEKNGLLFETENSVSLGEKIELLIKEETLSNKIIIAAKVKALDKFESKKQLEKLITLFYKELLS
ncbi:glycosyltransferase family 4 protein [Sulfurimonas sp. SAG-AH-194-C21]|nr:glycosyltransferase family 4 protein [Sulfurimonas sp. SAG-AH-194-C21]